MKQTIIFVVPITPNKLYRGDQVRAAIHENYPSLVVPVTIHRDPAVSEALACARPVLHYQPKSRASLDIQYVADWLLTNDSE